MKIAIIISEKDIAGKNIRKKLKERYSFFESDENFQQEKVLISKKQPNLKIYSLHEEAVYAENLDSIIQADFFIFATKHQSKAKIPSLSVHVPGNWGKAELGGKNRELCIAPTKLLREGYFLLKKLNAEQKLGFEVVIEVTHHGPFLEKPCMFVEIGSTEKEWKMEMPAEIIADTIIELTKIEFSKNDECFIGVGGQHTSTNFLKILEKTKLGVGHICPKYALSDFDEVMLKKAIEKCYGDVKYIILDWKGMGKEKERIKKFVGKFGIEIKRTTDF